ncbi:MAG: hypothetical protein V3V61_01500, partial [Gammaproteobacteria bacterium]
MKYRYYLLLPLIFLLTNFAMAYQLCEVDDDDDVEISHCIAGTVTSMQDIGNDKFEYTIEDYKGRTEIIDTDDLKIYLNEDRFIPLEAVEIRVLEAEMAAAFEHEGWLFLTRATKEPDVDLGIHFVTLGS